MTSATSEGLECFFNLFLEVSHISNKLEHLEFKLEKNIGILKHAGKDGKDCIYLSMDVKDA